MGRSLNELAGDNWRIIVGDVMDGLRTLPAGSVHCAVTSPPYFALRDYGVDGQIGSEPTLDAFVATMVAWGREVWRVLRDDGTLWLNLGDTYSGSWRAQGRINEKDDRSPVSSRQIEAAQRRTSGTGSLSRFSGLKPKDMCGVPWRVALALQADGWYLRSDVIWCLSAQTWIYARTQKGDMPMMVKDLARLDPKTVRLWNGEKWTQLLGMNESPPLETQVSIKLRSGETISCTPTHKFPTRRGLLSACEIIHGDILESCQLPEPENPRDCSIDNDSAWFAGLYLAEGSRSGEGKIQISGHANETHRWERVQKIAEKFGGSAKRTISGNKMDIRVYGRVLNAIIDELVSGNGAHRKCFAPVVWRYSNRFIGEMLDGYLSGDGHWDAKNNRWRLGFCRNVNLERDLRTACARLGYSITLNRTHSTCNGKKFPSFRGEIRKTSSDHHNNRSRCEVVSIGKGRRCKNFDLGVEDPPNLFALASGVLSHNSKPNPMPSSVVDRPTTSHEYIFLLSKSERYFYDAEAIREKGVESGWNKQRKNGVNTWKYNDTPDRIASAFGNNNGGFGDMETRNARSVWKIATQPYRGAHFATFPEEIPRRCILAGTSERGVCPTCGAPWRRLIDSERVRTRPGRDSKSYDRTTSEIVDDGIEKPWRERDEIGNRDPGRHISIKRTVGWEAGCGCNAGEPVPATVLEPFAGSGTTLAVARQLGRAAIGCELNPEYAALAEKRINQAMRPTTYRDESKVEDAPLFARVQ